MQLTGSTYAEVYRDFRWGIPARFNIAEACCDRHAEAHPERTALIFEQADGSVTRYAFGQLRALANRAANMLVALGLKRGDRVAIHLPQCPETLIMHLAVQKCGGVALPMFQLFGPDAVGYRLQDSQARIFISSVAAIERCADALSSLERLGHVIAADGAAAGGGGPAGSHDFWSLIERASDRFDNAPTGPDDPALLMYTSGTTGNPKGVLHGGRVLLGHLPGVALPHEMAPQSGDCFWTPADWAWAGGLLDVLLPALYWGLPVVASRTAKFEPEWAFAFMARHQVRNVFMPPTALRMMRQVPAPGTRHEFRLRSMGTGGEKLGEDMIAWGRETFDLTLNEFYGQTEVNLVLGNSSGLFPVRAGSMGRAIPGHVVEVVDAEGSPVPDGETGIVAVKRPDPVMFLEYWRNPEATAAKFRGNWCLLGDIATRDAEGYFWFQGRDDDIINSAGYRIGPGEVEECLALHPAVALSGVVGSPDPIRGEIVSAFIVLAPGFEGTPELAREIQDFVRERLAAHEYPRRITFIDQMPLTVTGKIRRRDLRELDRPAG